MLSRLSQFVAQALLAHGQFFQLVFSQFPGFVGLAAGGCGLFLEALGLFHQGQLLVFQLRDVGFASVDFVGECAILLVLLGLELLEGVTFNLLLFGVGFQFQLFSLRFDLFELGLRGVHVRLGGGGPGLERAALRFNARQLVLGAQYPAIPVLQYKQFFDYFLHWATFIPSLAKDVSGPGGPSQPGCWLRPFEHFDVY